MATKKSKASTKSTKTKATKTEATAKPAKKPEVAASKTKTVEKTKAKKSCFSGFFARKYEAKEGILTIFKDHKFYGALIGEIIGTMFITLLLFSLLQSLQYLLQSMHSPVPASTHLLL